MRMRRSFFLVCLIFTMIISFASSAAAQRSIDEILSGMTLEQKIGQMIMPSLRKFSSDGGEAKPVTELPAELGSAMRRIGPCGYILFDENCADIAQLIGLTDSLRSVSPIPPFIAVDQEGGRVSRIPFVTTTCGNMALSATDDPAENIRLSSALIARELAALGINVDLAPVADVNSEPSNPIIGVRSFSDDPETVARYAAIYADGMRSEGIVPVYKHFPGHGDTKTDSHIGLPVVQKDLDELKRCELIPFAKAIVDGAEMIMTAHIRLPKIEDETRRSISDDSEITLPATLSRRIITDLLRTEMGFEGIVITDSLSAMAAISENFTPADAASLAINAGVDILLMPIDMTDASGIAAMERLIADTADRARSGDIDMGLIDAAVRRILSQKQRMGLLGSQRGDDAGEGIEERIKRAEEIVGCREHRDLERRIARSAITLIAEKRGAIPLRPKSDDKVVILFPRSDMIDLMDRATESLKLAGVLPPDSTAICYGEDAPFDVGAIDGASCTVLVSAVSNMEHMRGPLAQRVREICSAAAAACSRLIVISSDLPCDVQLFPDADAVLAAYMPRRGINIIEAIAAAFGAFVPTGHLPMDMMELRVADDGRYYFTDEVLYPRGYKVDRDI